MRESADSNTAHTYNLVNTTGEQVICTDITNNDFTLSYAVPYSNVTLKIETTAL